MSLTSSLALFARIFEYLDLPVDVDDPAEPVRHRPGDRARARAPRGRHLRATRAATPPRSPASTSTSRPARTLALVGETGSGKSTLAALVARLHDPTGGRITIDGVDLRDLRLADLAAVVGVVSQETYLLHTTVRENLRYAKPDATDAEIEAAARAAQIHDLIAGLPDGYDTMVGSRGHRFSGGEKQRLAIARTLLRDPRVLVLDEATSALDTETERAVQDAFDALAARPHHDHHRPPAVHRARRRPDRRPRPRPHRRGRHARRAARARRAATPRWPPEQCGPRPVRTFGPRR